VIWPEERTSWTAAAVLLAYDALCGLTPASRLFSHASWRETGIGQLPAGGSDPDSQPCGGEPVPRAARR